MKNEMNEYGDPPPYPGTPTTQPVSNNMPVNQEFHGNYPMQPPNYLDNPPQFGFSGGLPPSEVIQTQPQVIVVHAATFGESPMQVTCRHCNFNVVTKTVVKPGGLTWLMFSLCCLFGCWFGCCLIPFCVDGFQDVDHHCPQCNSRLGTYNRM